MHKNRFTLNTALMALSLLSLAGMPLLAHANYDPADNRVLAGWVEKIILKAGDDAVKAKLDTGAKTSSINALNIKRFEREGDEWVRFTLKYNNVDDASRSIDMERPVYRNLRIKEHEGENDRRAVVKLDFCFSGQWHTAQFSLVNRSRFVYPVLLGRRFLRKATIIDPLQTFITQPTCSSNTGAAS